MNGNDSPKTSLTTMAMVTSHNHCRKDQATPIVDQVAAVFLLLPTGSGAPGFLGLPLTRC
ncbi:MAG: hypothetical protein KJ804_22205 [Proteobacteria bacterium]|nr:hypothetical protein [Pseudomonadota bacterium]MBU1061023.1 hypothetical protein [Pseudomonadota bacterium]